MPTGIIFCSGSQDHGHASRIGRPGVASVQCKMAPFSHPLPLPGTYTHTHSGMHPRPASKIHEMGGGGNSIVSLYSTSRVYPGFVVATCTVASGRHAVPVALMNP